MIDTKILVGMIVGVIILGALLPAVMNNLSTSTTSLLTDTTRASRDVSTNDTTNNFTTLLFFDIDLPVSPNVISSQLCITNTTVLLGTGVNVTVITNTTWDENIPAGGVATLTTGTSTNLTIGSDSCIDVSSIIGDNLAITMTDENGTYSTANPNETTNTAVLRVGQRNDTYMEFTSSEGSTGSQPVITTTYTRGLGGAITAMLPLIGLFLVLLVGLALLKFKN